ncbi:MAG: dolichyl-phosphate beta-glucosyltransferase [Acidobacteriota bacterium]
MSEDPFDLTVVVPAYNEEDRLGGSLDRLQSYLGGSPRRFEIVVVDDGSADGTAEVVRGFAPRSPGDGGQVRLLQLGENQGKGAAVRRGVLDSRGLRVLISDADLSTPIEELERLEPQLERAPVVLGSRAVDGADITRRQPLYREIMGKTFNRLIRLAGVRGIRDTQCGFKLLDGDVARRIFGMVMTPGFAFDVEVVWLAHRLGYGVAEVGVRWHNSPTSRVQPLLDPPRMLAEIVRFRWHHRRLGRS